MWRAKGKERKAMLTNNRRYRTASMFRVCCFFSNRIVEGSPVTEVGVVESVYTTAVATPVMGMMGKYRE